MGDARFGRGAGSRAGGRQPEKSRVGDDGLARRRHGLTTKTYALVDTLGNTLYLRRGTGQQADWRRVADLLLAAKGAGNVLADKGYDMDQVLAFVGF